MTTPLLIAHRGGSHEAPENTMAAFRHAIGLGVRMVELDVQMTLDEELVVIHDLTVDRTTDGSGVLGGFTLEEIRRLDAGSWFGPDYAGERIPTLREALELCASSGVGVVIELKEPRMYPGIEAKVVALIGEMWMQGAENLWCISFDHQAVRHLRTLDAIIPLGYLFVPQETQFASSDPEIQACCPFYAVALQHPEQVAQAHALGKVVLVYTVNSVEEMQALAEADVDGLVTDEPAKMLAALG